MKKFQVKIVATTNSIVGLVVQSWTKTDPETLRKLVQERAPSGITVESVAIQECDL